MKRLLSLAALAIAWTGVVLAGPVLTLNPLGGSVSGTPGYTVGWGFTLSNDSGFMVPSSIVFCEGVFNSGCTPTFGTFTDFAAQFQFNVVGSTLTETFNNATKRGIGSFAVNANAPAGVTDAGRIYLVYDTFSCDIRDNNCNPTQTAFSQLVSAPASVTIVAAAAVPEPGSAGTIALGLLLLAACAKLAQMRSGVATLSGRNQGF